MVDYYPYKPVSGNLLAAVFIVFAAFINVSLTWATTNDCVLESYESVICINQAAIFELIPIGTCTIDEIKWDFGVDASTRYAEGAGPFKISFSTAGVKSVEISYFDVESDTSIENTLSTRVIEPVEEISVIPSEPCIGEKIELSAKNLEYATFVWKGGNLPENGISDNISPIDEILEAGQIYTLEWYVGKDGQDGGCMYDRIKLPIRERQLPAINFLNGNNFTVCEGEPLQLVVNSPGSSQYNWACGENVFAEKGAVLDFIPEQNCQIKINTTEGDCIRTGTATINHQEIPDIKISPEKSTICEGLSVVLEILNSGAEGSYTWSDNVKHQNSNNNNVLVTPKTNESYFVTWEANGCQTTSTASIEVSDATSFLEHKTVNICEGEEIRLEVAEQDSGYMLWFGGDLNEEKIGDTIHVNPTSNTTYGVIWKNDLCSDTGSFLVKVNPKPVLELTSSVDEKICEGDEVVLTANILNYDSLQNHLSWTQSSQQTATISNSTELSFIATSSHMATAVLSNTELCYNSIAKSINVEVAKLPKEIVLQRHIPSQSSVEDISNKICFRDTLYFEIVDVTNLDNIVLLNAETGEVVDTDENLIEGKLGLIPKETNNYMAEWSNDCSAKSNVVAIEVLPIPDIDIFTVEKICPNQSFEVKILPDSYNGYNWTGEHIGKYTLVGGSTLNDTADSISNSNKLSYDLTVTEGICKLDTTVVIELVDISADVSSSSEFNEVCEDNSILLKVEGADSYIWEPANLLDNYTSAAPVAFPVDPVTNFKVTAFKENCVVENSIDISVVNNNDCEIDLNDLKIPNAITPNGDGKNDMWVIPAIDEYKNINVTVFSPSGAVVYDRLGYNNDFNGTYKGQIPEGTYYYVITKINNNGSDKRTGTLTIIR